MAPAFYDDDIPANVSIFFKYNGFKKICENCSNLKIKTPKRPHHLASLPFLAVTWQCHGQP